MPVRTVARHTDAELRDNPKIPAILIPALVGHGGWERLQRFAVITQFTTLTDAGKHLGRGVAVTGHHIARLEKKTSAHACSPRNRCAAPTSAKTSSRRCTDSPNSADPDIRTGLPLRGSSRIVDHDLVHRHPREPRQCHTPARSTPPHAGHAPSESTDCAPPPPTPAPDSPATTPPAPAATRGSVTPPPTRGDAATAGHGRDHRQEVVSAPPPSSHLRYTKVSPPRRA